MLNLEPEIVELAQSGAIAHDEASRRIAFERRDIFSVHAELRAAAWLGAMLIASAVAIIVSRNFERIGPLAISVAIFAAAAGCYAVSWYRRRRGRESLVDEYVVLLGALLLSAGVGFVEAQYKILGDEAYRHFLVVAVLHAAAAYAFRSRAVLSLSLAAMATWLGFEIEGEKWLSLFAAAAIVLVWRALDRNSSFTRTLEHFAANLAFFGALDLTFDDGTRLIGALITLVIAAVVIVYGFRKKHELFVLYAYVYAVIAVDAVIVDALDRDETLVFLYLVISTIAAIVGLIVIHARFKRLK